MQILAQFLDKFVSAVTVRNGATSAAPAAGAVIATTGALAAGSYFVEICIASMDTVAVGKGILVEHRNAADNATTAVLAACVAGESRTTTVRKVTVAANERIRAIAGSAAGAASSLYSATISVYPTL